MAYNYDNLGFCLGDVVDFDPYRGRGDANPSTRKQTHTILRKRKIFYSYIEQSKEIRGNGKKFNSSKIGKDKNDTSFNYQKDDLMKLIKKSSTPLRRRGIRRIEDYTDGSGLINREMFIDAIERFGDVTVLLNYCNENKPILE